MHLRREIGDVNSKSRESRGGTNWRDQGSGKKLAQEVNPSQTRVNLEGFLLIDRKDLPSSLFWEEKILTVKYGDSLGIG